MSARVFNLTECAVLLGINRTTLASWIRRGAPVIEEADRGRGLEWKLSFADIADWRIKCAVEDAVLGIRSDDGKVSKNEADRRRAIALAIVAEVEADEAIKSVVSVADAKSAISDFLAAIRAALSGTGLRIAERTAAVSNPSDINKLCQDEINIAFRSAEADLAEKWSTDAPAAIAR